MKRTMMLAFSAGVLIECGSGGDSANGERRASADARDPGSAEARSGATGQPAAEAKPFGPRSEERRRQDSVLRSGSLQRQRVAPDST